jgi:hypothetical protein
MVVDLCHYYIRQLPRYIGFGSGGFARKRLSARKVTNTISLVIISIYN